MAPLKKHALGLVLIGLLVGLLLLIPFLPLNTQKRMEVSILNLNEQQKALVYFGFPGCNLECPVTLAKVALQYRNWISHHSTPPFQLRFVNVLSESTPQSTQQYAQMFDPDFVGIAPTKQQFEHLKQEFNLDVPMGGSVQAAHLDYLFLLEHQSNHWYLVQILTPEAFETVMTTQTLGAMAVN